jgi:formate dehydrogenase major subunit
MGCDPRFGPGYTDTSTGIGIEQIAQSIRDNDIKAFQIIGDDPSLSQSKTDDLIETLDKVEFLIVHESFESDLTKSADIVFPILTFAEKTGTYTNLERRIHPVRPALGQTTDSDEDWRILSQIAERMGSEDFKYSSAREVFQEIRDTIPFYNTTDIETIDSVGQIWQPETSPAEYAFAVVPFPSDTSSLSSTEFPFVLAPGRVLQEATRDAMIETEKGKHTIGRSEIIEINKSDAEKMGISEGQKIKLVGEEIEVQGTAHVNGIHDGMIGVTELFGNLIENIVSSKDINPMANASKLELTPVKIEKIDQRQ